MRTVNYTVKDENGKIFRTKNYMDATVPGNRILRVFLTDVDETSKEMRDYTADRITKLKEKKIVP